MTIGNEPPDGELLPAAAELLRKVLDELPPDGSRDIALRSKVEQRATALDDVVSFVGEAGGAADVAVPSDAARSLDLDAQD